MAKYTEDTCPVTIDLTKPEQDLCLQYCFERTFKTAINLLADVDTTDNPELENTVGVCSDDLEHYLKLEKIRNKIVQELMKQSSAFAQPIENREWDMLAMEDRGPVLDVIRGCIATGLQFEISNTFKGDRTRAKDFYAYPHPGGGIAWGRNGPPHSYNTHRGVIRNPAQWLERFGSADGIKKKV
jgi:hypothetical protein